MLGIIVAVNAFLIWLYVSSNYSIANEINSNSMTESYFRQSPFSIQFTNPATGALFVISNFPFWLFFVSTAINLFFILILLRSK
jgi:hypothetical protein